MSQIVKDYDKGTDIQTLSERYSISIPNVIKLVHYHKVEVPYKKSKNKELV